MKNKSITLGMLKQSYHGHATDFALIFCGAIICSLIVIFTGNEIIAGILPSFTIIAFPYMLITRQEQALHWEKFQISMPLKRGDYVNSLYLNILISTAFGMLTLFSVLALGFFTNTYQLTNLLDKEYPAMLFSINGILLVSSILYPVDATFTNLSPTASFVISAIIAMVIASALTYILTQSFQLDNLALSKINLAFGLIAFVISYFVSKKIHAKLDF